jgi:OOP family OmpA-OmpF porin
LGSVIFASMLFSGTAMAQGYVGASIGQSELKEDCIPGFACDFKDTGFKLYGGYMFTPNLGVEGAYVDLGKARLSVGSASGDLEATGFALLGKAVLPIDQFSLFAKLGFAYLDTEFSATGPGGSASISESNTDVVWGVGAGYSFTRNLGVRVEYERFRAELPGVKSDVDLLSVGVTYRF